MIGEENQHEAVEHEEGNENMNNESDIFVPPS